MSKETPMLRELFIEELLHVTGGAGGGGPVEELKERLGGGHTTMACCEEGPDGCDCPTPI